MAKNSFNNVEGAEEIKNLFEDLLNKAPAMYEDELEKAGEKIKNSAKSKIKDKTGKLKQSIKSKNTTRKEIKGVSVIAGGNVAPHAHLVEFGHRLTNNAGQTIYIPGVGFRKLKKGLRKDVAPNPFFRNAFDEYKNELARKLEGVLDTIVR